MCGFGSAGEGRFTDGRGDLRVPARSSFEHQAVRVVAQSIDGGRGEEPVVGEGLIPFLKIKIAGDDSRGALIALTDEFVQIFVRGWPQGFKAEIIDNQQGHTRKCCEFALVGSRGAGGIEAGGELRAGGEQHIDALGDGAMAEGLSEMSFADSDLANNEDGRVLGEIATGGQVVDERTIELLQSIEVELVKCFGVF